MASRYIPNDFPRLLTVSNTGNRLRASLEDIVANDPPRDEYPADSLRGLWSGPTGIAYLFLHVSVAQPKLLVAGRPAAFWAQAYVSGSRRDHHHHHHNHHHHGSRSAARAAAAAARGCGVGDEPIAYAAVRASVSKDLADVRAFVAAAAPALAVPEAENDNNDDDDDEHEEVACEDELLHGRAGALYLLRMVRHWVPNSAPLVELTVARLTARILERGPDWTWHGRRYLGAVHGDVGIVTQLVLTTPPVAPRLEATLARLLDAQLGDGNWPSSEGHPGRHLVQFCHGAPGFVLSLLSLRPYFPALQDRVDAAIKKARECIWEQGLLRKEPSLCHGILGNALTFPPGPQRDHFLALAVPEKMAELKQADPTLFQKANYGREYATLAGYVPSAAWTWMVCGKQNPRVIAYNDI